MGIVGIVHGNRCPKNLNTNRPSVLYNHVSKTGGTDVKGMLTRALGASGAPSAPFKLIHLGGGGACRPVKANSNQIGSEGALIIEDDIIDSQEADFPRAGACFARDVRAFDLHTHTPFLHQSIQFFQ